MNKPKDIDALLPVPPLSPDPREEADRLRAWCQFWCVAAFTGWLLALFIAFLTA